MAAGFFQSAMERLPLLLLLCSLLLTAEAAVREREDPPSAGCQLGAKLFGHGARVPRSDPCERCLCFAAQVICWQERCPNQTKPGCTERRMPGVCCPALECSDTSEYINIFHLYSVSLILSTQAPRSRHDPAKL